MDDAEARSPIVSGGDYVTPRKLHNRFGGDWSEMFASHELRIYSKDAGNYSHAVNFHRLNQAAASVKRIFSDMQAVSCVCFPEGEFLSQVGIPSSMIWVSSCVRSSSNPEDGNNSVEDLLCLGEYHEEMRASPLDWDSTEKATLYEIYDQHEITHIALEQKLPGLLLHVNQTAFSEAIAEIIPKVYLDGLHRLSPEAIRYLLDLPEDQMLSWSQINDKGIFHFDQALPHENRGYASCLLGGVAIAALKGDGDIIRGITALVREIQAVQPSLENTDKFISELSSWLKTNGYDLSGHDLVLEGQRQLNKWITEQHSN